MPRWAAQSFFLDVRFFVDAIRGAWDGPLSPLWRMEV